MVGEQRLLVSDETTIDTKGLVSPGGDVPGESRIFYRWLNDRWENEEFEEHTEEHPPVPTQLSPEYDNLRELLLEREVKIVRLESQVAEKEKMLRELDQDVEEMEERYRMALNVVLQHRTARNQMEAELASMREANHSLCEEIGARPALDNGQTLRDMNSRLTIEMEKLQTRLQESETARASEGQRYREIFAEKDNYARRFQKMVAERDQQIAQLERQIGASPKGMLGFLKKR